MYEIKRVPEDFRVVERYDLKLVENARYSYFKLWKRDYSTIKAIQVICRKIRFRPKFVNFAGTKDRIAITEQYISISKGPRKDYDFGDIKLTYLGLGEERLNLGCLDGNEFTITVRNIDSLPDIKDFGGYVLNRFDDQRFGIEGKNHIIGRHIIKKEFDKACDYLDKAKVYLEKNPTDFIGALRTIPKKLLLMYAHAYQSYLWNEVVKRYETKSKDVLVPIIGYDVLFDDDEIKAIYEDILNKEDINYEDFKIPQMPELHLDGDSRQMYVKIEDFEISELQDDEFNVGKKKCVVSFYLPKGAYATNVIKVLFENI